MWFLFSWKDISLCIGWVLLVKWVGKLMLMYSFFGMVVLVVYLIWVMVGWLCDVSVLSCLWLVVSWVMKVGLVMVFFVMVDVLCYVLVVWLVLISCVIFNVVVFIFVFCLCIWVCCVGVSIGCGVVVVFGVGWVGVGVGVVGVGVCVIVVMGNRIDNSSSGICIRVLLVEGNCWLVYVKDVSSLLVVLCCFGWWLVFFVCGLCWCGWYCVC